MAEDGSLLLIIRGDRVVTEAVSQVVFLQSLAMRLSTLASRSCVRRSRIPSWALGYPPEEEMKRAGLALPESFHLRPARRLRHSLFFRSSCMLRRQISLTAVLAVTFGTFAGCMSVRSPSGLLEQTAPATNLSSRKLRVLLTDYVPQFGDRIEQAADEILSQTSDPQIRRNALLWKSNAISACFRAASRPDPLAAYLDVWVLCRQMTQFLEQPSPNPVFGPWQAQAWETSRQLEAPLAQIRAMLSSNTPLDERFVEAFARDHPITSLYFDRASLAAPFIEDVEEPTRDMLDVVAEVSENLAEMQKLSAIYADFVPKQARWQAELLLLAATEDTGLLAKPLYNLGLASQAMDRLATSGETVPQLVERERDALHEIVRAERTETMAQIDQMRNATVAALRRERSVILQSFHDERRAFNRDLEGTVGGSIDKIDALIDQRARELSQVAERVAERLWQRVLQLLLLIGLLGAAGIFAVALCKRTVLVRRPAPAPDESLKPAMTLFEHPSSPHGRAA